MRGICDIIYKGNIVLEDQKDERRLHMEGQAPFDISYLPLTVTLISRQTAELPPYLGSTLRGMIGNSLFHTDNTAYRFLYENGSGKQDIVKPYIFVPPEMSRTSTVVRQGRSLTFEFVLLGNAIQFAPALIHALENIQDYGLGADRYPFRLSQILHSEDQRIIWQKGQFYPIGIRAVRIPVCTLPDVRGVSVKLLTPLQIRRGGQLLTQISFETLIRNITNRVLAVTERYTGWTDSGEIKKLQASAAGVQTIRENLRVKPLKRYSNRTEEKMDFSGLLGNMEYRGDLTPFVPWLAAAQRLHVGRHTTFGMGKIRVNFL